MTNPKPLSCALLSMMSLLAGCSPWSVVPESSGGVFWPKP